MTENLQSDLKTLKSALRSRLVTLERDLVTFHYEKYPESEFSPESLSEAKNRIASWTEKFFDIGFTKANSYELGPGEYVAVDPFASRVVYGGISPQLYVITLAHGSRLLNGSVVYSSTERKALEEIFNRYKCIGSTTVYPEDFFSLIGDMRRSMVDECMRLVIRAFQDLEIDAILYNFTAATTINHCQLERGAAFDIIRNRAIRFDHFGYYDNQQYFESHPLRNEVANLYAEASLDPMIDDIARAASFHPPASLPPPKNLESANYVKWKTNHIYMCGQPSSLDLESPEGAALRRLIKSYRDPEAISALNRFREAFFVRFPERPMRWKLLRGLESLTYEADSEAQFRREDWTSAKDLNEDAENPNQINQAAAFLHETYTGTKFSIREVLLSSQQGLPSAFQKLGFGPRLARMTMNDLLIQLGGIPLLTGHVFKPQPKDWVRSKKLYLDLLSRCAAQYKDKAQSTESIANSECGLRDKGR